MIDGYKDSKSLIASDISYVYTNFFIVMQKQRRENKSTI